MNGNPLISVIVPIYNVELYLRCCIESIIDQTYRNLEIILVDDESPDNCGRICEEYAGKDQRIIVIHQKNKGLSGARNAGIDRASGEYLAFVDSDDFIDVHMYEKMMGIIEEYDVDIAVCGRYYVLEDGRYVMKDKKTRGVCCFTPEEGILTMNSFASFDMAAWDKLYHRKLFETIRFPEGKLSEDFFIMCRLFDHSQKIAYLPEPLYYYRQRPESISRNKKINFDFIEAGREQMEYVSSRYPMLTDVVKTAYASANMTVYNFHLKSRVDIKPEIRKQMKENVKENLNSVMRNPYISSVKKIQAAFFCTNFFAYNVLFYLFKLIKKV